MSFIGNIIGDVAGGILGTKQQAKAAQAAAATQAQAAEKGIAAVNDATTQGLSYQQPYRDAGSAAIARQMTLLGLNGTAGQQEAINGILSLPDYTTAVRQGEEAILANASATGGLRGGNVQNSLANFRADQFGNAFQRYLGNISGVVNTGQTAANASTLASANEGQSIAALLAQQGAATAGGQLAKGSGVVNAINQMAQVAGAVAGFTNPVPKGASVSRGF